MPSTCAEVRFDMRGGSYGGSITDAEVGDLLYNPKGGDGHVLVAEVQCGAQHNGHKVDCGCGGWGMRACPSTTLICECGEDGSWRDHHYVMLATRSPSSASPAP
jgi:hypothetical protein